MGKLVDGIWKDVWYDTESNDGRFVRADSSFRDWVRADGSTAYAPAAGRYHLYVSLACPWAHRTLIYRKLKGLEDAISVSIVDPLMAEHGWELGPDSRPEPVAGASRLHEVYTSANPSYTGRVTVPVLWDRERQTIVSNESSEIIRMFDEEFTAIGDEAVSMRPLDLREQIDSLNDDIYSRINNGVYRCGFATTQEAYEEAYEELFAALDTIDERLATSRYLLGNRITEADWRLFTTLVRFDAVYVGHFKCNRNRIADFDHLSGYLRDLYQVPGVSDTVDFDHIKQHYYRSHATINPAAIVPAGPKLDLDRAHGRTNTNESATTGEAPPLASS
jgi:putative glutathione S-transferase